MSEGLLQAGLSRRLERPLLAEFCRSSLLSGGDRAPSRQLEVFWFAHPADALLVTSAKSDEVRLRLCHAEHSVRPALDHRFIDFGLAIVLPATDGANLKVATPGQRETLAAGATLPGRFFGKSVFRSGHGWHPAVMLK